MPTVCHALPHIHTHIQAQLTFSDQLATKQRELTHARDTYERRVIEIRRVEEEKRMQLTVQLEECTK